MQGEEVPREAEARFACLPEAAPQLSAAEPKQCQYVLTLLSPDLCAQAHDKREASEEDSRAALELPEIA